MWVRKRQSRGVRHDCDLKENEFETNLDQMCYFLNLTFFIVWFYTGTWNTLHQCFKIKDSQFICCCWITFFFVHTNFFLFLSQNNLRNLFDKHGKQALCVLVLVNKGRVVIIFFLKTVIFSFLNYFYCLLIFTG